MRGLPDIRRLGNLRSSLRSRAPAMGLLALYAYLAFHAFSGSQGVLSWMNYSAEAELQAVKLAERVSQREALQTRVDALSSNGLDLDALDIESRRNLYVSDAKDVTIWLDP